MAGQTTSNLSDSLKAEYLEDYIRAARMVRLYDNLSLPIGRDMSTLAKGTSINIPFVGDLPPGTTTISETSDVTPSTVVDTTVSVSPTSRWGAIQCSEKLLNTTYTPYGRVRFEIIGKNQMETVDILARDLCTTGTLWRSYAQTARTSLDAATNYYLTSTVFNAVAADLMTLKVPQLVDAGSSKWIATIHPYALTDFLASTDILAVGQYQKSNIVLGQELGEYGHFKIVCSPWAKVFWGAGTTNTTSVATTVATSTTANGALDKYIEVAANTNIAAGQRLMLGTRETSSTMYTTNELVTVAATPSGTTVSIVGEGANGGLRFTHEVGETVTNRDSVGCAVFGGPMSLVKVWDTNMDNEYGTIVGPKKQGLLDQFESLSWKFYGNYGRPIESRIYRYEHTFSRDA